MSNNTNNNKNSNNSCAWLITIIIIAILALCGRSIVNSNSDTCSKAGCSKAATNHGYCTTHYFETYSRAYEYNHRGD